jgi:hypothetical protein
LLEALDTKIPVLFKGVDGQAKTQFGTVLRRALRRFTARKPWNDVYRSFAGAAQLADSAIGAAEELQHMA